MATWMTYGPLTLKDVETHSYANEPFMTDDGVKQIGNRHTYVFTARIGARTNQNNWQFKNPGTTNWEMGLATSHPAYSVSDLQQVFAKQRLRWKLVIDDTVMVDTGTDVACDMANGPFVSGLTVTKFKGGGMILVRGKITATVRYNVDGEQNPWVSVRRVVQKETDGDTWLQTRTSVWTILFNTQILQNIVYADNDPRRHCDHWIQGLGFGIGEGFKRQYAKVEVASDATKATVTIVDKEQVMPLGILSPAIKLTPIYSIHTGLGTGGKEGAPVSGAMLQIDGIAPKNGTRWDVLKLMTNLVIQKLTQRASFMFLTDATITYDLENNRVQLIAKAQMKPPASGPGGLHLDINAGLNAEQDYGDIDIALEPARREGDGKPGTARMRARAPEMAMGGTAGSYLGIIFNNIISASENANERAAYDILGKYRFCENESSSPGIAATAADPQAGDIEIEEEEYEDTYEMPDAVSLGFLDETEASWAWEMVSLATRYITSPGKARIPTAGVMPGGSPGEDEQQVMVIDLHGEYGEKAVRYTFQAVGTTPPPYPHYDTGDPDDVLLRTELEPMAPTVVAFGVYGYTVSGTYYYARKNQGAVKPGSTIGIGRLPNSPGIAETYNLNPSQAESGFLPKGGPADDGP